MNVQNAIYCIPKYTLTSLKNIKPILNFILDAERNRFNNFVKPRIGLINANSKKGIIYNTLETFYD